MRESPVPMPAGQVEKILSLPSAGLGDAMAGLDGPVLVLGAGGKMGLHVCAMLKRADELRERGRRVTAVSRFSTDRGFQRGCLWAPIIALSFLLKSTAFVPMAGLP